MVEEDKLHLIKHEQTTFQGEIINFDDFNLSRDALFRNENEN